MSAITDTHAQNILARGHYVHIAIVTFAVLHTEPDGTAALKVSKIYNKINVVTGEM